MLWNYEQYDILISVVSTLAGDDVPSSNTLFDTPLAQHCQKVKVYSSWECRLRLYQPKLCHGCSNVQYNNAYRYTKANPYRYIVPPEATRI